MSDRPPQSDDSNDLTGACRRAAHVECPHLHGSGGGFNPRRLRLEFGAGLCKCPCHQACPVQYEARRMTVSHQAWYDSCTCAGAEDTRQRLNAAGTKVRDFSELRDERQRRRATNKDATEATRARAGGRSREEIREIYLVERQARNLPVPADPVLDAVVEQIATGNPLPAISVLGDSLMQTGKRLNDAMSQPRGRHAKESGGGGNQSG